MDNLIENILTKLEDGLNKKDVQHFLYGVGLETIPKSMANQGVIVVNPISTDIEPVTTGVTDEESYSLEIILVKNTQTEFYQNSQKEGSIKYLVRIMEGRDAGKGLSTNTVRYIIRTNFRNFGLLQNNISIEYDTDDVNGLGLVTATMTLTQVDHTSQLIS